AETLLLVASDRVSAFDVVLGEPVPHKGAVLTQLSAFWFERLATVISSHFLSADADEIVARIPALSDHRSALTGRAMLVRRTTPDGRLLVIAEMLTPDSSRFWPADRYAPGRSQPSVDKQPLRDYLAGLKQDGQWDGNAPPPPLPREVVEATSERYLEAYKRITGRTLELG